VETRGWARFVLVDRRRESSGLNIAAEDLQANTTSSSSSSKALAARGGGGVDRLSRSLWCWVQRSSKRSTYVFAWTLLISSPAAGPARAPLKRPYRPASEDRRRLAAGWGRDGTSWLIYHQPAAFRTCFPSLFFREKNLEFLKRFPLRYILVLP
jgi:hypothetical protein